MLLALLVALTTPTPAPHFAGEQRALELAAERDAFAVHLRQSYELAQAMRPGGSFFGGTLTLPLVLDATNTLCSQALAVSFSGDSDLGLQRSAANILLLCASSGVVVNGPITVVANAACTNPSISLSATSGISFNASGHTIICQGGNAQLTVSNVAITAAAGVPFTAGTGGISIVNNGGTGIVFSGGGAAAELTGSTGDGVLLTSLGTAIAVLRSTSAAAGSEAQVYGAADASGDIGVAVGTSAALSGAGLDTTTLAIGHTIAGTPVYQWKTNGAGHVTLTGATPSSYTSGTCTNETGTGDDAHGSVTADCTAGQTAIVTFNRAYTAAPVCNCTPANAAADIITLGEMFCDASTTVLTITLPTAVTAAKVNFQCME